MSRITELMHIRQQKEKGFDISDIKKQFTYDSIDTNDIVHRDVVLSKKRKKEVKK